MMDVLQYLWKYKHSRWILVGIGILVLILLPNSMIIKNAISNTSVLQDVVLDLIEEPLNELDERVENNEERIEILYVYSTDYSEVFAFYEYQLRYLVVSSIHLLQDYTVLGNNESLAQGVILPLCEVPKYFTHVTQVIKSLNFSEQSAFYSICGRVHTSVIEVKGMRELGFTPQEYNYGITKNEIQ